MKREGRQHGMVRSIQILPSPLTPNSGRRFINELDSPPTAGVFTKVSRKPTNHSKFTGKCGLPRCVGCHDRPACKSKDKVKGSHKVKSSDVDYSGFSATGILDHLGDYGSRDYVDYHDDDVVEDYHDDDVVEVRKDNESDLILGKDVDEDEDEGWCLVTEI